MQRGVLGRAKPRNANRETGKPQYSPPQLCICTTGENFDEKRMRATCSDNARCFTAIQPMPKNGICSGFCFYVPERGTRKPRAIKKAFCSCRKPIPPDRMHHDKMVALIDIFLE